VLVFPGVKFEHTFIKLKVNYATDMLHQMLKIYFLKKIIYFLFKKVTFFGFFYPHRGCQMIEEISTNLAFVKMQKT
jgi:hypothetical protein